MTTYLAQLDMLVAASGYQNRPEALRDLTRAGLQRAQQDTAPDRPAVATMHVHLDHESCLKVTVLKGQARDIGHFADHVIAERGVRHGEVVMLPVGHGSGSGSGSGDHHHD